MDENADTLGILDRVQGALDVCSVPPETRGVGSWMDLVSECARAITILTAARDAAVVRLAAIDEVVGEDGVVVDKVNGLGTASIDAGAMVATATGTTTAFGEEMVAQAITRVVRVPALHEAMAQGILDDYKARCVASELTDVPPELGRTVLEALAGDLSTTSGPALRRRTRDILFRLSPDLLRRRIKEARKGVGLRRWVGEPGTDRWAGSFPSESAARAWAAIDALARRYRADGTHPTLEAARAHALLDLVNGNATVETVLQLTVPESAIGVAEHEGAGSGDVHESAGNEPDRTASRAAGLDEPAGEEPHGIASRAAASNEPPQPPGHPAHGPQPARPRASRTYQLFVGTAGVQGSAITWMPWSRAAAGSPCLPVTPTPSGGASLACHPETGALLDVGDLLASKRYRPGERLKALVRQRDGRCRFPGCSVSARSCDLDHVRPWPHGPTSATNLICLCRRHHRVKQRERWRVMLLDNGVVEWTDPSGRLHSTSPVDHLGVAQTRAVLVAEQCGDSTGSTPTHQSSDSAGASAHHQSRDSTGSSPGGTPRTRSQADESSQQRGEVAADTSPNESIWAIRVEHDIAARRAETRRCGKRGLDVGHSREISHSIDLRHRFGLGHGTGLRHGIDVALSNDYRSRHRSETPATISDEPPPF